MQILLVPTLQAGSTRHFFLHLGRAGDGRDATLAAAVAAGPALGLNPEVAGAIATRLSMMVGESWRDTMERRGVDQASIGLLEQAFSQAMALRGSC